MFKRLKEPKRSEKAATTAVEDGSVGESDGDDEEQLRRHLERLTGDLKGASSSDNKKGGAADKSREKKKRQAALLLRKYLEIIEEGEEDKDASEQEDENVVEEDEDGAQVEIQNGRRDGGATAAAAAPGRTDRRVAGDEEHVGSTVVVDKDGRPSPPMSKSDPTCFADSEKGGFEIGDEDEDEEDGDYVQEEEEEEEDVTVTTDDDGAGSDLGSDDVEERISTEEEPCEDVEKEAEDKLSEQFLDHDKVWEYAMATVRRPPPPQRSLPIPRYSRKRSSDRVWHSPVRVVSLRAAASRPAGPGEEGLHASSSDRSVQRSPPARPALLQGKLTT
jgi:hypothetical protein